MVDNPPGDKPLVTLSVQVTDRGDLSISEDARPKPPLPVPEKARARQASVRQANRSSGQHKRAASSRTGTRVSSRRNNKPKTDPRNVSNAGPKNSYRTVHFTLGSTRVLKESWFMDGSTQVELKPLGLLDHQQVPPVYGCIDSRGELRLSMGNYNQNALGRMASLVAARGLEEDPDTVDQQPKRVVVMGGKTWPTFPVAVTIVDDGDETPSQSAAGPSKGVPPSAGGSTVSYCVGEPERYSRLHQPHNPRPTVQMLRATNPSPEVPPMTSTTGVIVAPGACGIRAQYQHPALRSVFAPVIASSKAVVLVAENENNSSSQVRQASLRTAAESLRLRKADPNDTRYASTESLCSIDLPDGRLYIAEQSVNSPPPPQTGSIPGQIPADENFSPPSRHAIQAHEMSEIQMGHDAPHHQNQPVLVSNMQRQATEITLSARERNHRNNTTTCIHDAVDKVGPGLPLETNTDSVEKNNSPLHTSPLSDAPSDIGAKSALNATSGSCSGPGADSMDEFLKYLQHLNTVMETVMAGGTDKPVPE